MLSLAVLYIISLFAFRGSVTFDEETFASAPRGSARPLDVYVDVLEFDPVRESVQIRLDVASASGLHGKNYTLPLGRAAELRLGDGDTVQDLTYARNAISASRVFAIDVTGTVAQYPFDRYSGQIVLNGRELTAKHDGAPMPLRVTVWKGVSGWRLDVKQSRSSDAMNALTLAFAIHRPAPLVFFACILYGLVAVIAISALTIGGLVFLGIRRVEPTLIGALAAMVFAMPVLRNLLPGTPPLGVLPDILILLWAEVLVTLGLALLVTAWARRGSGS